MAAASTLLSRCSTAHRNTAVLEYPQLMAALASKLDDHMAHRKKHPQANKAFHFCCASTMWAASCYGFAEVARPVAATAVSLLTHPDPLLLRYSTLIVWLLGRHKPHRGMLGELGALELLSGWVAALLLLVKVCMYVGVLA